MISNWLHYSVRTNISQPIYGQSHHGTIVENNAQESKWFEKYKAEKNLGKEHQMDYIVNISAGFVQLPASRCFVWAAYIIVLFWK